MTLAKLTVACYSIAPKRSEPPPARANALRGIPPAQELLRAKQNVHSVYVGARDVMS
jgi:hypothetical protein